MAKELTLEVVTPERSVLTIEISSLVVPAIEGYLGILGHHAPLITGLQPGLVKYQQDGKDHYLAISSGFLEVSQNKATILVDTAERPNEIDRNRAEAALDRAEKLLHERPPGLDIVRAEFALRRARARLKVREYHRE